MVIAPDLLYHDCHFYHSSFPDLDVERELNNIKIELDQNDLGRAFYKRIVSESDSTYIDWENPENNTFHLALEVTCQNGGDEFRPDIVIFYKWFASFIYRSQTAKCCSRWEDWNPV